MTDLKGVVEQHYHQSPGTGSAVSNVGESNPDNTRSDDKGDALDLDRYSIDRNSSNDEGLSQS